ncbi:hypothetical protein ABW20_dc0104797 [Dactylellina cionopaga]|nr:hypothetical protein ABW20_dc0104797 [Dactylellina cionopaga]
MSETWQPDFGTDANTFTSIPILDFTEVQSPATKPFFLANLRKALVTVGFFYLKNPPIPKQVQRDFIEKSIALCNLPLEKKLEIDMINSKHFLGYSRVACEKTAKKTDYREIFDFLTPLPAPSPDMPVYLNVQGPSQWPDEEDVPGFRHITETYLFSVGELGREMTCLVAEALDLESSTFHRFFYEDIPRNKLSVAKYCAPEDLPSVSAENNIYNEDGSFQGVGAHKDGSFLIYLLQMTEHAGLEVQNKSGTWIPVHPIPDTLVINVGRSLESLTGGVCKATTHRVNLRRKCFYSDNGRPLGPRYSAPVFQNLRPDLTREELAALKLPKHITDLVKDDKTRSDADAYFDKQFMHGLGRANFAARLTSLPEVARRWYPKQFDEVLRQQKEFVA